MYLPASHLRDGGTLCDRSGRCGPQHMETGCADGGRGTGARLPVGGTVPVVVAHPVLDGGAVLLQDQVCHEVKVDDLLAPHHRRLVLAVGHAQALDLGVGEGGLGIGDLKDKIIYKMNTRLILAHCSCKGSDFNATYAPGSTSCQSS